jgi:hypothetical protein
MNNYKRYRTQIMKCYNRQSAQEGGFGKASSKKGTHKYVVFFNFWTVYRGDQCTVCTVCIQIDVQQKIYVWKGDFVKLFSKRRY